MLHKAIIKLYYLTQNFGIQWEYMVILIVVIIQPFSCMTNNINGMWVSL